MRSTVARIVHRFWARSAESKWEGPQAANSQDGCLLRFTQLKAAALLQ